MSFEIRRATSADAAELAANIRDEDLAECLATGYLGAHHAVLESLEHSTEAWAVVLDDELACIVGVDAEYFGECERGAMIWALTSKAVDHHKVSYVKASRAVMAMLGGKHEFLFNLVDSRYERAISWLVRVCGFVIRGPVAHPKTGASFMVAVLTREHHESISLGGA